MAQTGHHGHPSSTVCELTVSCQGAFAKFR